MIIFIRGQEYELESFRVIPDRHFNNPWKYRFVFCGESFVSINKYQSKKGALVAGELRLCSLVRKKLEKPENLLDALCVAEHEFINGYYRAMGKCAPPKLFEAQQQILERCINAYIQQVRIEAIV